MIFSCVVLCFPVFFFPFSCVSCAPLSVSVSLSVCVSLCCGHGDPSAPGCWSANKLLAVNSSTQQYLHRFSTGSSVTCQIVASAGVVVNIDLLPLELCILSLTCVCLGFSSKSSFLVSRIIWLPARNPAHFVSLLRYVHNFTQPALPAANLPPSSAFTSQDSPTHLPTKMPINFLYLNNLCSAFGSFLLITTFMNHL